MSIEARQIQETLYAYAAILNFTPSPQGLRAKFGACSVQNAQLLVRTTSRNTLNKPDGTCYKKKLYFKYAIKHFVELSKFLKSISVLFDIIVV